MKNTVSIRKNRDFLKIYRTGSFYVGRFLVIYLKANKMGMNRLGITTARNYGNAVNRNRLRRLIRENYRLHEDLLNTGYDIIVSGKKPKIKNSQVPSYKEIEKEMLFLFRKSDLMIDVQKENK